MENNEPQSNSQPWERKLIEELALSSLQERRRARRWGMFFKLLYVLLLVMLIGMMLPNELPETASRQQPHTALVNLSGIIMDDSEASADNIIAGLQDAFENSHVKGVIIQINSPGGSPVQAGYINDEIRRLKKLHPDTPVYAVVRDICASGGYYVAVAADEIYVDKASIVGSIGVLMDGFGFVNSMDKLGVERRLLTAGNHKGIMDPFSPMTEFDQQYVQKLLDQMHQQFIQVVKEGRGDRLKENDQLFSGLFWTGEESVKLGLADGLGSSSYVARELIQAEDIVDYTPSEDLLERFARQLGAESAIMLDKIWSNAALPAIR
jgi:protease-4